jgi:hypothetical protein
MHIFVVQGKTTFDVSGFLLTAKNCYYLKGCQDFEAKIPWMQGGFEGIQ